MGSTSFRNVPVRRISSPRPACSPPSSALRLRMSPDDPRIVRDPATSGTEFGRRLLHGLLMYPVVVAGIYVVGRLVTDGGEWFLFALITGTILTVLFVILPGTGKPHNPAMEILYLSIQMTTWWTFGLFHRWAGDGTDWLLYWLVAAAIFAQRLGAVRRWEPPPE